MSFILGLVFKTGSAQIQNSLVKIHCGVTLLNNTPEMRKIAIIGSGYSGMLAARALLKEGCEVSLYSDRSAEDWLHNSKPTGTAGH